MRENRLYGSEGGAAELNRPSLPLSSSMRPLLVRRSLAAPNGTAIASENYNASFHQRKDRRKTYGFRAES